MKSYQLGLEDMEVLREELGVAWAMMDKKRANKNQESRK